MKTAIITGASSGLGAQFVRRLSVELPGLERVWLIARRREKLEETAKLLPEGMSVKILPLDLCSAESFDEFKSELEDEKPDVRLLINNAGCGYLGNLDEADTALQLRMTDLNIRALTAVTSISLPYMTRGSRIINVSSIASFCANPRMTVYSSTKAYVSSFTRGLSEELRPKGISVTDICPGPMRTEFLDVGGISGNSKMFDTLPYCDPAQVVRAAYRASAHDRTTATPTAFFRLYRGLAKILPHSLIVKMAKT